MRILIHWPELLILGCIHRHPSCLDQWGWYRYNYDCDTGSLRELRWTDSYGTHQRRRLKWLSQYKLWCYLRYRIWQRRCDRLWVQQFCSARPRPCFSRHSDNRTHDKRYSDPLHAASVRWLRHSKLVSNLWVCIRYMWRYAIHKSQQWCMDDLRRK